MAISWRLGIDLGTNSLGWWAFRVQKAGPRWQVSDSLDGGVYIFPDGHQKRPCRGQQRRRTSPCPFLATDPRPAENPPPGVHA